MRSLAFPTPYKFGNKSLLLPNLYYLCKANNKNEHMAGMNRILEYAKSHDSLTATDISDVYGMKQTTARQHLSRLASNGSLVRVGYGRYALGNSNEVFPLDASSKVISIYQKLHSQLPFADFCVYSGAIFEPLQHHISINHCIYVETNRDTVDSVFTLLKDKYDNVYHHPDENFMRRYVDLRKDCIIVKPLVTEAPTTLVNGVPSPTLEKILVDILADNDLEYLRGSEYQYMFETAVNQYVLSESRLLRYARRRGVQNIIQTMIKPKQ